jgi:hypothetical protein
MDWRRIAHQRLDHGRLDVRDAKRSPDNSDGEPFG